MSNNIKVLKIFESFVLGKCACGCNEEINIRKSNGRLKQFITNHHWRLAKNKRDQKGEKNATWKGGRYMHDGYWFVLAPDHPNADNTGYVRENVKMFTDHYKCCMLKWSRVHHINEIKTDNRIENLQGMTHSQHMSLHKNGCIGKRTVPDDRVCLLCKSNITYSFIRKNRKYFMWYKFEDGFMCAKCRIKNK